MTNKTITIELTIKQIVDLSQLEEIEIKNVVSKEGEIIDLTLYKELVD